MAGLCGPLLRHLAGRAAVAARRGARRGAGMHTGGEGRGLGNTVHVGGLLGTASGGERGAALAELRAACLGAGYGELVVPEEAVPTASLSAVYGHLAAFHALDPAVKERYHARHSPCSRGWTPRGEEPAYEANTVSSVEAFDLARDLPADHPAVVAGAPELGPNVYPTELPGFREDVGGHYRAMSTVVDALFGGFEELLSLAPGRLLGQSTEQSRSTMRLLRYGGNADLDPAALGDSNRGIAAHTDFECFTIIHQSAPGLEVAAGRGGTGWVQVEPPPGHYILLVGDVLERLTHGWLRATRHRVVHTSWERQSVVRFNGLDGHVVVEPLPQFLPAEGGVVTSSLYPPVTQADHIANKVEQALDNLKEHGA